MPRPRGVSDEGARALMRGATRLAVGWRRVARRCAALVTVAVVIWMVVVVAVALAGSGHGGGMQAFNACIRQSRTLLLVRQVDGTGTVETIRNGSHGAIVAEVSTGRTSGTLGGAEAANGGYVMSTASAVGHDTEVVTGCWDRFFPLT